MPIPRMAISIGYHADQAVIFGHRQQSDAERRHC